MARSKNYNEELIEALKNPEEAVAYLNSALEEGEPEIFLLALKNVADAHGGLGNLAKMTDLNRENLYRILSAKGNPRLESLHALLDALGFKLSIELKDAS